MTSRFLATLFSNSRSDVLAFAAMVGVWAMIPLIVEMFR